MQQKTLANNSLNNKLQQLNKAHQLQLYLKIHFVI